MIAHQLFTAILLVSLEEFNSLAIGAGGDANKISGHRSGVGVLVVTLGEQFLLGETAQNPPEELP